MLATFGFPWATICRYALCSCRWQRSTWQRCCYGQELHYSKHTYKTQVTWYRTWTPKDARTRALTSRILAGSGGGGGGGVLWQAASLLDLEVLTNFYDASWQYIGLHLSFSLWKEFCTFLAKNLHLFLPSGAEFRLSVAKNVALFQTVRILRFASVKWCDRGSKHRSRKKRSNFRLHCSLLIEKMNKINTKHYWK